MNETRLNGTTNGSDLTVYLVQLATSTDGASCTTSPLRYLAVTELSSGTERDLVGSSLLEVRPYPGQATYCLGLYSVVTNGAADATTYYPTFSWAAYVAAGRYAGLGVSGVLDADLSDGGLPPKQQS